MLEAPPEGVVDSAAISLAKGGPSAASVKSPQKALWVRFHFLALPKSGKVKIVWRTPSLKFVGAVTKPAAATLDSSLASAAPLARGRWYARAERQRRRREARCRPDCVTPSSGGWARTTDLRVMSPAL